MAAVYGSNGKRSLEGPFADSTSSEPLLKKRSSGLEPLKASPACSSAPQPAPSSVCGPSTAFVGPYCMPPMGAFPPMGMGCMLPMTQQAQQAPGSAPPPAMGVPSMLPPTPMPGFGYPPFMPPPFMMMWMQQMAMHTAMACTMQKMHAHAQAQSGASASSSAAALAPLPYPMVMGAFSQHAGCTGLPLMPMCPMQTMEHAPSMGMAMCPQPCAAPVADAAPAPAHAPMAMSATAAATAKPASKAGSKGQHKSEAIASAPALVKRNSSSMDSEVSGGDTLLDVDFASFIDSFLLAPPGAEDDCLRSEGEQGGADQSDLSDSMLLTSDACHPLSLSHLDDCVLDLLTTTTF